MDFESETFVAIDLQNTTIGGDVAGTLDTSRPGRGGGQAVFALQDVRPRDKAQNGRGWSDDGSAYTVDAAATQGVAVGPIPFDTTQITSAANRSRPGPGDPCHPLAACAHPPAIAYQCHNSNVGEMDTLRKGNGSLTGGGPFVAFTGDGITADPISANEIKTYSHEGNNFRMHTVVKQPPMGVRRLTPREMERLQGFPDDFTAIPWRGKPVSECPDGPRAKALGNSMAVPVMRWIGERIAIVEKA